MKPRKRYTRFHNARRAAGQAYHERLLALPQFLRRSDPTNPGTADIVAGFALTGYFLARHVFEPRGLPEPEARTHYLALLARVAIPREAAAMPHETA